MFSSVVTYIITAAPNAVDEMMLFRREDAIWVVVVTDVGRGGGVQVKAFHGRWEAAEVNLPRWKRWVALELMNCGQVCPRTIFLLHHTHLSPSHQRFSDYPWKVSESERTHVMPAEKRQGGRAQRACAYCRKRKVRHPESDLYSLLTYGRIDEMHRRASAL